MYKQLIKSFASFTESTSYWFDRNSDNVVVTYYPDWDCTIYDNAQSCFECEIKATIEDCFNDEDLDYCFDKEELEFIKKNYPDSEIAGIINEL